MDRAQGQKARPVNPASRRQAADSSDEAEKDDDAQIPIGFNYTDNFPALPDADGKGKKMKEADERRKRLQAAGG